MKPIIIYALALNILGFFTTGTDKLKAKHNWWRTKESTIFVISLLGGAFGTLIGMKAFRHKTRKLQFAIGIPIICILNLILYYYIHTKVF